MNISKKLKQQIQRPRPGRSAAAALLALLATGAASAADVTVNLTAQPMTAKMPDGISVPMWGYCTTGSCSDAWAPGPTIVVAPGDNLTIHLTNSLPTGTPTSVAVLGQLGGGLGTPTKVPSPDHLPQQGTTWPVVDPSATFTPPHQGERVRTFGAETSNGGSWDYTWSSLRAGTYIYETGTRPSIQAPMGLYGVLIVTTAPVTSTGGTPPAVTISTPGSAYTGVNYDADATFLFSEIDPAQNSLVNVAGGDESKYPPAVNYAPLYFLINGHPYDKSQPSLSTLTASQARNSGNIVLRLLNAGLRTHIPSVVGLDLALVAEDGNLAPGNAKRQSEVLLTAGKTVDAIIAPAVDGQQFANASYSLFDRQLSLSNDNAPDGGMQALLTIGTGTGGSSGSPSSAVADDAYTVPYSPAGCGPAACPKFSGNVLRNDTNVVNASVATNVLHGTLALKSNGTFTYTAAEGYSGTDSFSYSGNNGSAGTANVTLSVATLGQAPTVVDHAYTGNLSTIVAMNGPGVLDGAKDLSNYKLRAVLDTATNMTVVVNADGSFTASKNDSGPGPYSHSFTYHAINAQGTPSAPATVTLTFGVGNGLTFKVVDASSRAAYTGSDDYSWTIEEDTTFHADQVLRPTGGTPATPIPADGPGTNFHRSHMPVVAAGCTGPVSCATGKVQLVDAAGNITFTQKTPVTPDQVVLDPNKYYFISVLPSDATGGDTGHTLGGTSISRGLASGATVQVLVPPTPLQPAQLSVFVFEDNNPTNGDIDGVEEQQGLGGFAIVINDTAGRVGDVAGQQTYDTANMPLTNSLFELDPNNCPRNPPGGAYGPPPDARVGAIYTCPELDIHGNPSPLAGHALIKNINPSRYDVLVSPSPEREARGETWLQVSTLEGTHANDAFAKAGEPTYFQEFGPPGFHAFVGFVNPDHIKQVNASLHGTHTVQGRVTNLHMSRPAQTQLYDAHSNDILSGSTCYVGLNSQNGAAANIAFARCDENGNFVLTGVPAGTHQIVVFDQWLDQIIEYSTVTVADNATAPIDVGDVPVFSWFTNIGLNAFVDLNGDGVQNATEPGVSQIPMTIRYRDGSISNVSTTDSGGVGGINELFPLFNWYVAESDTTRYKTTKITTAVDGGGPVANDANYAGVLTSTYPTGVSSLTTYTPRAPDPLDATKTLPDGNALTMGIQGFISQTNILNWAKQPYDVGENGGIAGVIIYTSTRGFDDPRREVQFNWEPLIPRVHVRLYRQTTQADGTTGLVLVDETASSSWDDALPTQCQGQVTTDPFFTYTLGATNQNKCYDGFHAWNQMRPAVYDGRYQFPSNAIDPKWLNPATKSLLPGKYLVEAVVPSGYEIVKEEDKNILIGDAWVAPVTQQFLGVGNVFILPDQAMINAAVADNAPVNQPRCVGELHRVPDYLTMFPGSGQFAPFAGADRALCNRKEVVLNDQMQAGADFHLFTQTPVAGHYTGMILDDASSEFNAAAPDFGEKFGVPFVPISIKDFNGVEISRTYADQWGIFNGLTPSSWEPNVPNPSGYAPNMLTTCMNDPGPVTDPTGKLVTDPLYNPMYSNFCYTNPFMPGLTTYLDTPVLPVAAFAAGYNPVDCAYPAADPMIRSVDSDQGNGPWVSATGHSITITAVGDTQVPNPAYGGPSQTAAPFNQKTIPRHYGFGGAPGAVTVNGVPLTNVQWSDATITGTIATGTTSGELVVTTAAGKSTVEAVTVTIEPTAPTRVHSGDKIQAAIDLARPGELIMIDAGTYNELLVMWKPVRLQGVGAMSVIVNAAKYPNEKLTAWRPLINQLFRVDSAGNQTLPAQVDPLPGQEITGGVVLLEPSVLSSEEGAGITVLASSNANGGGQNGCGQVNNGTVPHPFSNSPVINRSWSNFTCAASRIDGLSVTGGDTGGGIYVNGWAHGLEIANNRVYGNAGSFTGGIRIGQPNLEDLDLVRAPFGFDRNVKIHHNAIATNGTVEANNGTPGGGGGLSLNSGSDGYSVRNNFVCGNYSMDNGGGIAHVGLSLRTPQNSNTIANNKIIFNQSFNQSNTVSGGGLIIEGETATAGGVSLGAGNVTVDANLIQGNHAAGGHGGGVRLQDVNGADVQRSSNNSNSWYRIELTNNIIANNVAGYAGGGVSLSNTVASALVNNTIAANDSTATVGAVFGADPNTSANQPAGISSDLNSPALRALLSNNNASKNFSSPLLRNNIVWQNRSFHFTSTPNSAGGASSYSLVPALSSACDPAANFWDFGVVGDPSQTAPLLAPNGRLRPEFSVLTPATFGITGYGGNSNRSGGATAGLVKQYCNGARMVAPGIPDVTPPIPAFQMQVAGAEDEGGNWIDVRYGPLSLNAEVAVNGTYPANGDYHIMSGSPAANTPVNTGSPTGAPDHDIDAQARPNGGGFDVGADELYGPTPIAAVSPQALAFGSQAVNATSAPQVVTLSNTGSGNLVITGITITGQNTNQYARTTTCPINGTGLAPAATCTISVTFTPTSGGSKNQATLSIADNAVPSPQTVGLTGSGAQGAVTFTSATPPGTLTTVPLLGTTLGFGNQSGLVSSTVTVTNSGQAPLAITTVNVGNLFGTTFSIGPSTCTNATVAVGGTCTVVVRFNAPTGNSPRIGMLTLNDNGTGSPQVLPLGGS
jgi:hypothetical protein